MPRSAAPSAVVVCILSCLSRITPLLLASSASSFSLLPSSPYAAAAAVASRRRRRVLPRSTPDDDRGRLASSSSSIALLPPQDMGATAPFSSHRPDDDDGGRLVDSGIMGVLLPRGGGSKSPSWSKSSSSSPSSSLSANAARAYRDAAILVTGASRGIGRSIALALSACGPSLLILSGRDEASLIEVGEECERRMATTSATTITTTATGSSSSVVVVVGRGGGGRVEVVTCDLDDRFVDRLATESTRLASERGVVIEILVNNGGVSSRSSFVETGIDVDERLMRVNFLSGRGWRNASCRRWSGRERGGGGGYAASKFAVQGYCESLRSELASSGVSVHVVSPGYVRTDLSLSAVTGDGRKYGKMDETTANGADPDEVAISILESVAAGKSDIVVAATFSARVAMWLKFLAPSILDRILAKRFEKQQLEMKKKE
ncbi:hypothetical protein ACHAW5_005266 [Stephanodiscus triporus]|uniref:Uncharacterized protein n=1 Tax=Stephanodiscus triporus TaxID=2934178 RepID=A0ABD3P952_9STRA